MSKEIENILDFSSLELVANQIVEGFITGLHKSPFHGFSVEFAEHRPYNSGQSTKNIDWKLYARTDKLFVKKYEEETNLRCLLVIDNSSSMYFPLTKEKASLKNPNKIVYSVYAAAALISMLSNQRDAFGLSLISSRLDLITDIKSSLSHKKYIYSLLEKLLEEKNQTSIQTKISPVLHELAEKIHKRSLVIIFTDLLSQENDQEEIIDALQHLRYYKHEVILFHVCNKDKEIDLQYKNQPHRFIDMETNEKIVLNPDEIREQYSLLLRQKIEKIKTKANNIKIDFLEVDINKSINQILLSYFTKRAKMH